MKYGCIGEHLKHSFSKEIHNALADYDYEICEIERERLPQFAKERDFLAINVTIPYKELIMPYLSYIDGAAGKIGAVNTVVNRGGELYGYNTDFYGMTRLIRHAGVEIRGKKVAILGTGGTSKTAAAVAADLGADKILQVSRGEKSGAVSYERLYKEHSDTEIIINTTPVGMFPNIYGCPVELERFTRLSGVIDAVYNPLRTPLIRRARELGVPAEGGLYMLVAQAVRASEIFLDKKYGEGEGDRVYKKIIAEKENIVLVGMPASGKSTVGRMLAQRLGKKFIDTDSLIVEKAKMSIPEIFAREGEAAFRLLEREVISEVAAESCAVIATGGGAVLAPENNDALKANGRIYFLDRSPALLVPTADRPLSSSVGDMEKRYRERYGIYTAVAEKRIENDGSPEAAVNEIIKDFLK